MIYLKIYILHLQNSSDAAFGNRRERFLSSLMTELTSGLKCTAHP